MFICQDRALNTGLHLYRAHASVKHLPLADHQTLFPYHMAWHSLRIDRRQLRVRVFPLRVRSFARFRRQIPGPLHCVTLSSFQSIELQYVLHLC